MNCSAEEFLLVLANWMNSSQRVIVSFVIAERDGLSGISVSRMAGYIHNIDSEAGFFVVAADRDGFPSGDFASIGLDGWEFSYGDPAGNPVMKDGLVGIPAPLHGVFSLTRVNHAQINIFALDPP